jgi:Rrf2 family protein
MRAILEISDSTQKGIPLNITRISESQQLSVKYLESLLLQLKNREILKSIRGNKGGYLLNREPEQITVFEVVEALDGPVELVSCINDQGQCGRRNGCGTAGLWKHLSETLSNEMKKITIKNLCEDMF